MDDVNRFYSEELLHDIFAELKKTNLNQLLRRKYFSTNKQYIYYDICYKTYGSHSFILLRNAFDPYCNIQQEMIDLCRKLQVKRSVTHYAVELFDKFFTNLIDNASKSHLLKNQKYSIELTPNFGFNIWNLAKQKRSSERLYKQLVDDNMFCEHGRKICMAICIWIASKQFECQHLQLFQVKSLLQSVGVPIVYCQKKLFVSIERKILSLVDFELNLTPLKIYVETILLIISRKLMVHQHPPYFTPEKVNQMRKICLILVENYYMLQVPFLIRLFQVFNDRKFKCYDIDDIDDVENLNRDKLLIASAIIAATCVLVNEHFDNRPIFRYISIISEIEYTRVYNGCYAVLQFLFAAPLENQRNCSGPMNVFSLGA